MVVGIRVATWVSALVVWVSIQFGVTSLVIISSFAQEFVEPLRNALGSLSTIFAHLDEGGPYPRPKESKKNKLKGLELAVGGNEAVEIGEFSVEGVTDSLDCIEGDAA